MKKSRRDLVLLVGLALLCLGIVSCGDLQVTGGLAPQPTATIRISEQPTTTSSASATPTAVQSTATPPPTRTLVKPTETIPPTAPPTPTATCTPSPSLTPPDTLTPLGGGTGQLAFSSHRDGASEIYLIDTDGLGLTRLTDHTDRVGHPAWSPDGTKLAFVRTKAGGTDLEIMVMAADGSGQLQLTNNPAVDSDPAWSPDGTKLAFTSNRRVYFNIYVLAIPDGRDAASPDLVQLTHGRGWDTAPAWSPDGQQIAFQSTRDGNSEIYVMRSDGTGLRNLTEHSADDAAPSWSPDGKRIVFHSDRQDGVNFQIYVMNADGSRVLQLTEHSGWDINPTWSPDGQHIAFYRELNQNFEIYVMNADGTDLTRLTHDPAFDGFASWQPLPTPTATPSPTTLPIVAPTPVIGAIHNRPGNYYDRLILRNYPRWFKVHIPPSYQPGVPMALVFNLHGLGSDLDQQEKLSGMTFKADEAGFIAVYPQAGASVWNIQAGEIGAIDVNFIRKLIEYLEVELNIDPDRIYATGFSNGGGMVHRLACDLSDRIAAIAPVAGAHMPDQPCEPERPVPALAIHGAADPFAPYLDERVGQNIPQWAADWATRNGCNPAPVYQEAGTGISVASWGNCKADASVITYLIEGVGHTWPGSPLGNAWGPNTQDLSANDVIWEFFAAHPRP